MRDLLAELDRLAERRTSTRTSTARWELPLRPRTSPRGRTRLVAEVERLFWRGGRYHRLVLSSAERFKRSVGSYHDFVDACEAHDPDRAERVIHDSMRWAVDLIAGSLPSERDRVSGHPVDRLLHFCHSRLTPRHVTNWTVPQGR